MIDAITYALLKGDIGQGTQEAVAEYLDEHLTNPSNPPIDTSLEISGAAADSKTTGDKITQLKEDLSEITSYRNVFNGYVEKGVDGNSVIQNYTGFAKSVLWSSSLDKYYIITATVESGIMNRFILYGIADDGQHCTELFRYTSNSVPNPAIYTYHNTTYKSLLLVLFFGESTKPVINTEIIESDTETIPNNFYVDGIEVLTADETINGIYRAKFTTIAPKERIDVGYNGNYYLIAVKTDNTYYGDAPNGRIPVAKGYLYLNAEEQKLYYSEGKFDNPQYLCDWNAQIANNVPCQYYHCTITKDGDIIFFYRPYGLTIRMNPIIYEHGNYNNPHVIDFGSDIKPFGFAVDSGVDHCYNDDYFMFAEYRGWNVADNDSELYIWKVVKPYNTKSCWTRVFTQYVRHYESPEGSHPGNEVAHFHTCNYDFYSGDWIASSGDVTYQIKFFISEDGGDTWSIPSTIAGQASRTVGVVFTKEGLYYQTDSTGSDHALYYVGRDNNGHIDFSTQTKICNLSKTGAAGYGTALLFEPYGLVFIDRMEFGAQGTTTLPLYFYDLKKNKLIHLMDAKAIDGYASYESDGRFGLPPLAYTHYQSPYENGIVMGATTITKPFLLDLVGNKKDVIVGVVKEDIV